MSDHDWLNDPSWPRVVTATDWRPGLPPPIEALRDKYPEEDGWEIEYATHIERADDHEGWVSYAVAIVTLPGRRTWRFFPKAPKRGLIGMD